MLHSQMAAQGLSPAERLVRCLRGARLRSDTTCRHGKQSDGSADWSPMKGPGGYPRIARLTSDTTCRHEMQSVVGNTWRAFLSLALLGSCRTYAVKPGSMTAGGTYLRAVTCALKVMSTSALSTDRPGLLRCASFLKGLVMPPGEAASVDGGVEGTPSASMGVAVLGCAASMPSPAIAAIDANQPSITNDLEHKLCPSYAWMRLVQNSLW